jgi:hypothetical protein
MYICTIWLSFVNILRGKNELNAEHFLHVEKNEFNAWPKIELVTPKATNRQPKQESLTVFCSLV